MAPKVALSSRYNHKSEAYSFGLILWEMLAHARPYEGLPSEDFEQRVCRQGVRPHVNAAWHPLLQRLLRSTFAQDFASRPDLETSSRTCGPSSPPSRSTLRVHSRRRRPEVKSNGQSLVCAEVEERHLRLGNFKIKQNKAFHSL
tara:strand:- start:70 stop:501 length:432 start_codon:yes stop_codon:yes gene_type:complete